MPRVVVRRHDASPPLDLDSVQHRSVPDVLFPLHDSKVTWSQNRWLPVLGGEDLATAAVDDGDPSGRTGGERFERRDAGDRRSEGQGKGARGHETDSNAGEASRPRADRDGLDIPGLDAGFLDQRLRVFEDSEWCRGALPEDVLAS